MFSRWLLDTNVLLRLIADPSLPNAEIASAAVDVLRTSTVLCYASQNVGEFWNTCTRPKSSNGFGLSVAQTQMRVAEIEKNFEFLEDGLAVHREWLRLLLKYQVAGVKVHDAHLVAVMAVHGVRHILTFDAADFARYTEVEAIHPQDAAVR